MTEIEWNEQHPEWPKKPNGEPMSPALAEAFLRGKGDPRAGSSGGGSGGGGKRRSKSDGPDSDYVEVKERIQAFYAAYPTGALQTLHFGPIDMGDNIPRIAVQAAAFRSPDDSHPGLGTSWMVVPGRTPYTNGSELENCETSAWGRAIAAIGILVDRSISSAGEIRSKGGHSIEQPSVVPSTNADALREAADSAARDGEPEPVSITQDAPSVPVPDPAVVPAPPVPTPVDPEPEATTPESPGMPKEATKSAPAPEEAQTPDPEPVVPSGLSYDEFKSMCRERFIPNGEIQRVARNLIERGALPQVGGIKDMSEPDRFTLFMAILADGDYNPAASNA